MLLGLVGLIDPPRPEARAAVAECRAAGIAVKMVTGDHAATASAIAAQLGLGPALRDVDRCRTSTELDAAEFAAACRRRDRLRPDQPRGQAAAGRGAAGRAGSWWR